MIFQFCAPWYGCTGQDGHVSVGVMVFNLHHAEAVQLTTLPPITGLVYNSFHPAETKTRIVQGKTNLEFSLPSGLDLRVCYEPRYMTGMAGCCCLKKRFFVFNAGSSLAFVLPLW